MESMDLKSKGDAMAYMIQCCSVLMTILICSMVKRWSMGYGHPYWKSFSFFLFFLGGINFYLVGGFNPSKKIWKSVGIMTFPIYEKIKAKFQTTNQSWVYESLSQDSQLYPQYWQSAPLSTTAFFWRFPKVGVPPNHLILTIFSIINHPFWITSIYGNLHIRIYIYINIHIYIWFNSWIPMNIYPRYSCKIPSSQGSHVTSLVVTAVMATRGYPVVPMDCRIWKHPVYIEYPALYYIYIYIPRIFYITLSTSESRFQYPALIM